MPKACSQLLPSSFQLVPGVPEVWSDALRLRATRRIQSLEPQVLTHSQACCALFSSWPSTPGKGFEMTRLLQHQVSLAPLETPVLKPSQAIFPPHDLP